MSFSHSNSTITLYNKDTKYEEWVSTGKKTISREEIIKHKKQLNSFSSTFNIKKIETHNDTTEQVIDVLDYAPSPIKYKLQDAPNVDIDVPVIDLINAYIPNIIRRNIRDFDKLYSDDEKLNDIHIMNLKCFNKWSDLARTIYPNEPVGVITQPIIPDLNKKKSKRKVVKVAKVVPKSDSESSDSDDSDDSDDSEEGVADLSFLSNSTIVSEKSSDSEGDIDDIDLTKMNYADIKHLINEFFSDVANVNCQDIDVRRMTSESFYQSISKFTLGLHIDVMQILVHDLEVSINVKSNILNEIDETKKKNFLYHTLFKGKEFYYSTLQDPEFCLYAIDLAQPIYEFIKPIKRRTH